MALHSNPALSRGTGEHEHLIRRKTRSLSSNYEDMGSSSSKSLSEEKAGDQTVGGVDAIVGNRGRSWVGRMARMLTNLGVDHTPQLASLVD